MARERSGQRNRRVTDSATAAALLAPCFLGLEREELRVLHLDEHLNLLRSSVLQGEPHAVELPIRTVIRQALAVGTRALVIAHNHPGGDPCPSSTDRHATRRLA